MQSGLIVPQSKHLLEILAVFAPQWAVQQLNRLLFGHVPFPENTPLMYHPGRSGGGGAAGSLGQQWCLLRMRDTLCAHSWAHAKLATVLAC